MMWAAQVLHVAAKDVRRHRALLGGFAAMAIGLAIIAMLPDRGRANNVLTAVQLLGPVGGLIAGLLIQADSPTREGAFWRMHPIMPSAVFAAKLLTIVMFVSAFTAFDGALAAKLLPPLVPANAVLTTMTSTGMAMAVGAITRDLLGYILAAVGVGIASNVATLPLALAGRTESHPGTLPMFALGAVAVCVPYLVVSSAYRDRSVGHARLVIGAGIGLTCVVRGVLLVSGGL